MSISISEVKAERARDIEKAIEERDESMLRYFATLESGEGNEEYALSLFQLANRWRKEDWSYDESIGN